MKIHFIAIGGSVMHNMAIELKNKGFEVTGSDDEIFEPAKSALQKSGLLPKEFGWFPGKINTGLDGIILGMHARADNPELLEAQKLKIPVYSFPEYIYQQAKNKKRVVIAGSHGKTTITSMVMHVLKDLDLEFDYMVGARIKGFDLMVKLTHTAPLIILEGDEYLSSAIDRKPKFLYYKPHISVITGIAWDHINVFPTFEFYEKQFDDYLSTVEPGAKIYYFEGDASLKKLSIKYPDISSYKTPSYFFRNGKTYIINDGKEFPINLIGEHNVTNAEAARLICSELGIDTLAFFNSMKSFEGAAKRLEPIAENPDTIVYRDFAHAPSKVKASVDAVANQYPNRELVACLELHTYSSLNKEFIVQYRGTMESAQFPIIFFNPEALAIKKMQLTHADIMSAFDDKRLLVFDQIEMLHNWLKTQNWKNKNLLLMSSGNFANTDLVELATFVVTQT